jgi:hypothetical protein
MMILFHVIHGPQVWRKSEYWTIVQANDKRRLFLKALNNREYSLV